jgi:acyl-CoA oxidase
MPVLFPMAVGRNLGDCSGPPDAVTRTADPAARALLADLHELFLIREPAPHTGHLLAAGRLSAAVMRDLPERRHRLEAGLAAHLDVLVDAFDVPGDIVGFSG